MKLCLPPPRLCVRGWVRACVWACGRARACGCLLHVCIYINRCHLLRTLLAFDLIVNFYKLNGGALLERIAIGNIREVAEEILPTIVLERERE